MYFWKLEYQKLSSYNSKFRQCVRVHFSRARSVGHENKNMCNSCTFSKNATKINYYRLHICFSTLYKSNIYFYLFKYLFIFCGKNSSSVSVFNLFLTNINTALQPATLSSEMQCEFHLECSQGPVHADIPVLLSTLFASLFSNLWFTYQILGNCNYSQQVCMFCCIAVSILWPVISLAPLF